MQDTFSQITRKRQLSNRTKGNLGNGILSTGPFTIIALLLATLLLTFTEIPIAFKYMAPFGLIVAVPEFRKQAGKMFYVLVALTIYGCIVGSGYVFWARQGSLMEANYPILREFTIGVIMLYAFQRVSLKTIVMILLLWGSIQLGAIFCQSLGYAPAQFLPFPITKADRLELFQYAPEDRFNGFTSESGVVGGMAALFLVLIVLIAFCKLQFRKMTDLERFGLGLTMVILVAILGLTLTKSGVVVLCAAFIPLIIARVLNRNWKQVFSLLSIMLAIGGGIVAFLSLSPFGREYIYSEKNTIMSYFDRRDISDIKYTGLATRIDGVELTLLGSLSYPFGLGWEGLGTFLSKSLDQVKTSEEMKRYDDVRMLGPKTYLFDSLAIGGFPGIILMLWFSILSTKSFDFRRIKELKAVRACLLAGLLALGFTVELIPFAGICGMIYCCGLALQRDCLSGQAGLKASKIIARKP